MRKKFGFPTKTGAERLFATLFSCTSLSEIPSDVDDTIEIAMASLGEYPARLLRLYFWDGLSYTEIAATTKSDPVMIRKAVKHYLSKLRDPLLSEYIQYGESYYRAERYKKLQAEIEFESHVLDKLEQTLKDIRDREKEVKDLIQEKLEAKNFDEIENLLDSDNMLLSELDVSNRSKNALDRNGLKTVGDLRKRCKNIKPSGMLQFRQLGEKGAKEIIEAVERQTGIPLFPENPKA